MSDRLLFALTLLSALGCGLVAGIFFAFSTFVMRALGNLPPAQGMDAMKSINVVVINPWFLTAFFGTAATCVLVIILSLWRWHDPGAAYLLVGSLLYLLGTVLVTMVFNVPQNNALKAVESASAEGTRMWADYLGSWTAWNHVRTLAALAAAVLLTLALCH
ncbi:MAG: DUF1772 domain-containing protein [Gammaproteobacteria bacterium]